MRALVLALAAALGSSVAHADPTVLRIAAIAPDGTGWARELRAFANGVEIGTQGAVRVKFYLGGIAGDEMTVIDRIRRGQLDGAAGALFCSKLAPSLLASQVPGLVLSRDEHRFLLTRLRAQVDEEFAKAGFVELGLASFGMALPFVTRAVTSWDELKKMRLFVWNEATPLLKQLPAMGLSTVPLPIDRTFAALEAGELDGLVTTPTAALAFQWSPKVRYFLPDLPLGIVPGCLIVSHRAFDSLPTPVQAELRARGAYLSVRFDEVGKADDDALLGGVFAKQGLKPLAASEGLRSDFFEATRASRGANASLIPEDLLKKVQAWLADYRSEHRR
jgi:TRAP-type C4-dicarboxylate transport system substrate-binding protein